MNVTRLLTQLTASVPEGIEQAGIADNSCILSTRIGVEALRAHGVRARPLPCILSVFNPEYEALLEARARGEEIDADGYRERGAWCVQVGRLPKPNEGRYNGHLVLLANERYLVDLSAGQVQRLRKGITAEAYWTEARELARGRQWAGVNEDDGCIWLYEPTKDKSYLRAPAWSAYRVSRRGDHIISERTRLRPDAPVAPQVSVPLPRATS